MICGDVAMSRRVNQTMAELAQQARRARDLNKSIHSATLNRAGKERAANELIPLIDSIGTKAERLEQMLQTNPEHDPKCCWYCGQPQNPTESDLEKHIELASASAPFSWPREAFIAKMRGALNVGDRIIWIGGGFAQVRRGDGRIESVFQRDA
jgi:hypothetical protein